MRLRETTIFRQLIFNIILPTLLALCALAFINVKKTQKILVEANENTNRIISDEITRVLEFQDAAFEILEVSLNDRMQELSRRLVEDIFRNTAHIDQRDLSAVQRQLRMNPELEDLYIIDRNGVVVNTTFEEDLGLNIFDFGPDHEEFLMNVFETGGYHSESIAIEDKTKRPRKYSYQPTPDGKYIIEIGLYSTEADDVLDFIEQTKTQITVKNKGILDVELFYMADVIFSLNQEALLIPHHDSILNQVFLNKDSVDLMTRQEKSWINYKYIFMPRADSKLYKGSVIRIISDRTREKQMLRNELFKFSLIFLITLFLVSLLIYNKTRVITDPIKRLVENVERITNGHFNERAEVIGNNEITRLSVKFNAMIEQLESYYNELEAKVRERTAEILMQKEEIEAQRDNIERQRNILADRNKELKEAYIAIDEQKSHIEDSIRYAKRIQTAILPAPEIVKKNLAEHFIFYRPKDIVSGDFYWIDQKEDKVMIAAVDCTGHGVPGAFMSIVGYNQLSFAVNVKKARTASSIMNALNAGVTETLKEDSKAISSIKDGMDMAMIVLDRKRMELDFCGAINPLILIRDNELLQFKGNRFPVGAYEGVVPQVFTSEIIPLKKGDCIYLFSDGYADQFGGEKGKKFMSRRMKSLLLEMHSEPMQKQNQILLDTFMDWKGEHEQVDDILVIGLRV